MFSTGCIELFEQRTEKISQLFSPMSNERLNFSSKKIFKNIFQIHQNDFKRPEDYINHSLYFEAKTFLHGLLTIEDKISMSHGLETRVPFLDNDLVDFASNIPVKYKLGNLNKIFKIDENETLARYLEKTRDGKLLLRDVMQNHIPSKITKDCLRVPSTNSPKIRPIITGTTEKP